MSVVCVFWLIHCECGPDLTVQHSLIRYCIFALLWASEEALDYIFCSVNLARTTLTYRDDYLL